MTVRGIRGATTVEQDHTDKVLEATRMMVIEMAEANGVVPGDIVSVIISTTQDIKSAFPAKAVRTLDGWKYVPVMCTHEMNVIGSMPFCIRALMHVNSEIVQKDIKHVYHNEAVKLRPDLLN
ncbi:chorismate mutase [Sporosarcina highlanderae]|uniref:chorismate mutase n=1 Tax=Sporosarcina highlanderae TaxID=3035916 RepID=A0ABT8JU97_9BACL|nr:chorismate mutase [Sporosarcina highlanderae]MDN4608733.1 chorismate mutase [Sporosarcina highlanderae]